MVVRDRRRFFNVSPRQWTFYSIVLLTLIALIAIILRANDPASNGLQEFLSNNEFVNGYVGELKHYKVVRTRYISKTNNGNRLTEYKINITGNLGSTALTVHAEYADDGSTWEYYIVKRSDS